MSYFNNFYQLLLRQSIKQKNAKSLSRVKVGHYRFKSGDDKRPLPPKFIEGESKPTTTVETTGPSEFCGGKRPLDYYENKFSKYTTECSKKDNQKSDGNKNSSAQKGKADPCKPKSCKQAGKEVKQKEPDVCKQAKETIEKAKKLAEQCKEQKDKQPGKKNKNSDKKEFDPCAEYKKKAKEAAEKREGKDKGKDPCADQKDRSAKKSKKEITNKGGDIKKAKGKDPCADSKEKKGEKNDKKEASKKGEEDKKAKRKDPCAGLREKMLKNLKPKDKKGKKSDKKKASNEDDKKSESKDPCADPKEKKGKSKPKKVKNECRAEESKGQDKKQEIADKKGKDGDKKDASAKDGKRSAKSKEDPCAKDNKKSKKEGKSGKNEELGFKKDKKTENDQKKDAKKNEQEKKKSSGQDPCAKSPKDAKKANKSGKKKSDSEKKASSQTKPTDGKASETPAPKGEDKKSGKPSSKSEGGSKTDDASVINLAAVAVEKGKFTMENRPMPKIEKPDDVKIAIDCVPLCSSILELLKTGQIGPFKLTKPLVVGTCASGIICEVGKSVKNLKQGDRVAIEPCMPCGVCAHCRAGRFNLCNQVKILGFPQTDGNLINFTKGQARYCVKLPDTLTMEEGALLTPLAMGAAACRRTKVRIGHKVWIVGAGPTGMAAMMSAQALGASKIVVTDCQKERLKIAESLGATSTIEMKCDGEEKPEEFVKRVLEALSGQPDRTILCENSENAVFPSVMATSAGGVVGLVTPTTEPCLHVPQLPIIYKGVDLVGAHGYSYGDLMTALAIAKSGNFCLRRLISDHFMLEQTGKALKLLEANKPGQMAIMVHAQERDTNNPKPFSPPEDK